jgi:hypothetical protein
MKHTKQRPGNYSLWKSGIPFFHSNLVQRVAQEDHSRIKVSVGGSQKLE